MYHAVLAIAPDDDRVAEKVDAVTGLPAAAASVRATVVHVAEVGTDVRSVPAVATALDRFADAGVEATAVREEGRPTEAVLAVARETDADCICVAGREQSPAGKRVLSPGAQQVLLNADRPVLVTEAADGAMSAGADHV
jgi:nucleotide-binding universal stress UspA family protein